MIVLNILGYFGRNKQNSYAALSIIYMFILFVKKKKNIYGFIRALCHGNVENGMSPVKIPLFETSL